MSDRKRDYGRLRRAYGLCLLLCSWLLISCGPEDAPVQAVCPEPLGHLSAVARVKRAASDARSRRFYNTMLPRMITLAQQQFNADSIARNFPELVLDPARLTLAERTRVRVYYVGASSGYVNSMGVNLSGTGMAEGAPKLVFPNAGTPINLDNLDGQAGPPVESALPPRVPEAPLLPGDFVDLGPVSAGTTLSFFLISRVNGQLVGVFTPLIDYNPDRIAHIVCVAIENTSYLMLSFEDMFKGGDKDYSDCVFAIELSENNVAALLGRLDPWRRVKQLAVLAAIAGVLIGVPALVLAIRRIRRRKRVAKGRAQVVQCLNGAAPEQALATIRKYQPLLRPAESLEWAGFEVTAREQLRDADGLCDVFAHRPEAFDEHESAALRAARTLVAVDRPEDFEMLRGRWRDREGRPAAWFALDIDRLRRDDKPIEARMLVDERHGPEAFEPACLARRALVIADMQPAEAEAMLAHALRQAPQNAEVHRAAAEWAAGRGDYAAALASFQAATKLAPDDPLGWDALADFLRSRDDYAGALSAWDHALRPPSLGLIWVHALFWRRVALARPFPGAGLPVPAGPLHPVITLLLRLPQEQFWNAHEFEAAAETHPWLRSRQEVFWLQVLQALRDGHEVEALSLINVSGFGARSWNGPLVGVLGRILTWRRTGFLTPAGLTHEAEQHGAARTHPFFRAVDRAAREGIGSLDHAHRTLFEGVNVYAAACIAAGWTEAARRLVHSVQTPADYPAWFLDTFRRG